MFEMVFNSENLPTADRFACWHEMTCRSLIPTRAQVDDAANFRAATRLWGSGAMQVSAETVESSLHVERTPKLIRQSDPEQYLLGVIRNGMYGFSQLGREAKIGAGDMLLFDSSQPFHVWYQGGGHHMFWLPKSWLPLPESRVAPLLARRLAGQYGIGGLLSHCLSEITTQPARYRAAEITRLLDIALDLLTTILAHELDALGALPPDNHRRALLTRVHVYIQQHLSDPDLSPSTIAATHHISLRHLQQLFAANDTTPAAWIRRQRLERCRHALADPAQRQLPIHAIAARWGFTDHAHFSRLFRTTYGESPRDYRSTVVRETTNPPRE
ncbi:helix-turn-helix domain-containing protein [Dactylosporangium sucinum]|uniref:AraC family transcriptional regulator n=1 Tax=Dactylosporangium sucinum TaxID=1424081 RepID=A0A917UBJ7_9ACTN|nr:helix-turn-helix domain-containing protein [Dactylosporangium sucinum]GGM69254.1 AraC family transcriptional regulator [Dactylosporangium sucinum]